MDINHVRPGHLCLPIEKVVEKHREALQGCCDTLDGKQAKGEKLLKDVAGLVEVLKKTAENAKAEISKQKNDVMKAVEDVFQSNIRDVDELYTVQEKLLIGHKNKLESFLVKVKFATNLSKDVLEKGSDEEIFESQKMVEERVETVEKESKNVCVENLEKYVKVNINWFKAEPIKLEVISKLCGTVAKSTNIDFLNSSILKKGEHTCAQQMFEWFGGNTWQLCYRASRDGWYAKDFHSKCDNKIPTIVLVKVVDYIFGGFTDTNWEQKKLKGGGNTNTSENAFMFSLKNKDGLPPFKSSILVVDDATVADNEYGAVFGKGATTFGIDLLITGHPPTQKCHSDFGLAYKLPDGYEKGTEKARCLLAGSFNFTPSEIEVFYQTKN